LGECHYRDGNYEAINKANLITRILKDLKIDPDRFSLKWASAAEGPRFVRLITEFTDRIRELGPMGSAENLDLEHLMVKLKAAKTALEGKRLRMVFARQAKYRKQGNTYREIPPDHKLHSDLDKTLTEEIVTNGMLLYLKDRSRPVEELAKLLAISSDSVIDYFQKLEKKGLLSPDRLIIS
jgi:F420-non-reducing hydrogenase iron-sulfur subunit